MGAFLALLDGYAGFFGLLEGYPARGAISVKLGAEEQ